MTITLHGPAHSTLLRAARLALEEKGIAYALREADLPEAGDLRPGRSVRHRPWDAPVLEHDGFSVSETIAITRYVDEAFPGPVLQPTDMRERARMTQVTAVADHHLHGPPALRLLWRAMYGEAPAGRGGPLDEATAEDDRPAVEHALDLVERLAGPDGRLAGSAFTLADCHLIPVIDLFAPTDEGTAALARRPRLAAWWRRVRERSSVARTRPRFGERAAGGGR
jgi:glutathione S-transferase